MSSTMIGFLGAAFSVALMLGLWGEEAYRRAGSSWWAPAALGPLGERLMTSGAVAAVMCAFFLGVRLLARGAASLNSGAGPSEYVPAPVSERASRP